MAYGLNEYFTNYKNTEGGILTHKVVPECVWATHICAREYFGIIRLHKYVRNVRNIIFAKTPCQYKDGSLAEEAKGEKEVQFFKKDKRHELLSYTLYVLTL